MPLRFRSNGRLALVGSVPLPATCFLHQRVDEFHRMDPGAGGAGHHHVGMAAGDRAKGLADGQIGRRFAQRDRVVRPAQVVVNRQVAGRHVGQIFQAATAA